MFEQNNESNIRKSTKSTAIDKAKMMSYENIEEARAKRAAKEQATAGKGKRGRKRKSPASEAGTPESAKAKVARMSEAQVAEDEVAARGMKNHCPPARASRPVTVQ